MANGRQGDGSSPSRPVDKRKLRIKLRALDLAIHRLDGLIYKGHIYNLQAYERNQTRKRQRRELDKQRAEIRNAIKYNGKHHEHSGKHESNSTLDAVEGKKESAPHRPAGGFEKQWQ